MGNTARRQQITTTIHPDTRRIISALSSEAMQHTGEMTSMSIGETLDMLASFWVYCQTTDANEKVHYGTLLEKHGVELPRSTASIRG